MAVRKRSKSVGPDGEKVIEALQKSGIIKPDVTVAELMRATRTLKDVEVEWTAVVDSDKWALIIK